MSALSSPIGLQQARHSRAYWALSDTWELTRRSLRHIRQDPEQLVSVTVQPVLLVIMFRYLFGGAISTGSSESYINFLMGGIFVETAALTATGTAVAVATDLQAGAVDRFRSLPMAESAVLTGHVIADLARSLIGLAVMTGVGLAVGFRPHATVAGWAAAIALTSLVTFALCWVSAALGMMSRSVEAVQQFGIVLILPILFSSAFVPTQTMPGWLRVVADNQPMTKAVEAVRALLLGQSAGAYATATVLWFSGISVLGFTLATALFRRRTGG